MRKIEELRLKIKELASSIKDKNAKLKEVQREKGSAAGAFLMYELYQIRSECRHHHIAFCELMGRTREQIEKPRKDNAASEYKIQQLKNKYAWEVLEEIAQ